MLATLAAIAAGVGVAASMGDNGRPRAEVHAPAISPVVAVVRRAAVANILAKRRALARRTAPPTPQLTRVMARFTARSALSREVALSERALKTVTRWPGWEPPRQVHLDVVVWGATKFSRDKATVRFVGYESGVRGAAPRVYLPCQRYTVRLHREGAWKTVSARAKWLTPEGPFGTPGNQVGGCETG